MYRIYINKNIRISITLCLVSAYPQISEFHPQFQLLRRNLYPIPLQRILNEFSSTGFEIQRMKLFYACFISLIQRWVVLTKVSYLNIVLNQKIKSPMKWALLQNQLIEERKVSAIARPNSPSFSPPTFLCRFFFLSLLLNFQANQFSSISVI